MRKLSIISILVTLAFSSVAVAQSTSTGTTTLSVTIGPEATISITNGSTPLTESGTSFANFTGTTNLTYQVRTSQGSGLGSVTLKVTTDFSPAGGPLVSTSSTTGDKLTYTCTGSGGSNPTVCPAQTASTTVGTPVLTFAADAHSNAAPGDNGTVIWTLVNDPKYKTGSYQATVTFTISAT